MAIRGKREDILWSIGGGKGGDAAGVGRVKPACGKPRARSAARDDEERRVQGRCPRGAPGEAPPGEAPPGEAPSGEAPSGESAVRAEWRGPSPSPCQWAGHGERTLAPSE